MIDIGLDILHLTGETLQPSQTQPVSRAPPLKQPPAFMNMEYFYPSFLRQDERLALVLQEAGVLENPVSTSGS